MVSSRSLFLRKATVLTTLLVGYFFACILQSNLWGNILSPANAFAAAGVLFYTFLRLDDYKSVRISMLFFSISCMFWGIADVIWAVLAFWEVDPSENVIIWVLYSLTNLFLIMSFGLFVTIQFRKWSAAQLIADAVTAGLAGGAYVWIIFFNRDMTVFGQLMQLDFTSITSVGIDILLATGIFTWLISIRTRNIPKYLLLIAIGVNLFALVDLLYYYLDLRGAYIPNSLVDFSYIFSLYCIALGALWKNCLNQNKEVFFQLKNIGFKKRWTYFLTFPISMLIISSTGLIKTEITYTDYAFFAALVVLNWSFSRYIQMAIENERLLGIEKRGNEVLELKVAEQIKELLYLANQDTLTALSNRRCFMGILNESIQTIRPQETLALMMLDMDRFKTINDSYGHDAGDKVLIEFANRLTVWNRIGATIARLGGDEFGFIFKGNYLLDDLSKICLEITDIFSEPILIGGTKMDVSASIGVSILSKQTSDAKTLMKNADIAMYQAKAQGYNKYQLFDPVLCESAVNSSKIELLLRQVDVEKEFELYYQPQFSLPNKELVGAEALIRWKSRGNGYIPPNAFIPVAEKIEYIARIGKWVMTQSVQQAVAWNRKVEHPFKIGMNISPRQLNDDAFLSILVMLIQQTGIDASWLDVEITESTMISQTDKVQDVFNMLKKIGVSVSIDDFGSGYSAMGYLNKYAFDRIKIDKSLIDNIVAYNLSGINIVKSIIDMSKSLGIKTIAEGVETDDQLDTLIRLGCDQVQGYLLGRPVPANEFERIFMGIKK